MVIIDPPKDPHGPPPAPQQALAPPPYAPLSPRSAHLNSPPLRSPGVRAPPSPFSAPASNFLTVKREKADITGSWNINTSLPFPPSVARTTSADSDTSSEAGTTDISSVQPSSVSSAGISGAVAGSAAHPNLKLFSPRGKIDAAIRVSGSPRAWIEGISREEDVTITFPPNANGASRAPIRLFARSTNGTVQVHLPSSFMGTLRVPSETVLPASLKPLSVVLSPSEPPIERPPIADASPVKPKLGLGLGRATSAPPSPPITAAAGEEVRGESYLVVPPVGPGTLEVALAAVSPPTPEPQAEGSQGGIVEPIHSGGSPPGEIENKGDAPVPEVEGSMILGQPPVDTPAQEEEAPSQPLASPPVTTSPAPLSPSASRTLSSPLTPPAVVVSHQRSTSVQEAQPASPSILVVSPTPHHHRSVSASVCSFHRPPLSTHHTHPASSSSTNLTAHPNRSSSNLTTDPTLSSSNLALNRSTSNLSIQPTPIPAPPTHSPSESSTLYFIGDLLHSSYDTNAPEKWAGDEFVLDSEFGRVKVCAYGEKAEVGWAEDVTSKVKEAVDWGRWKNVGSGVKGMQMSMPKVSLGSMGKKFKFK
ncbi:hypothetical protein FRC08_018274 [Ceratobasidium sp. 394]|nr:hypothetical protein FRC08_018274 [Ceratobasidium sp. 394]